MIGWERLMMVTQALEVAQREKLPPGALIVAGIVQVLREAPEVPEEHREACDKEMARWLCSLVANAEEIVEALKKQPAEKK